MERRRSCFTLSELLLVLAVVFLLATILFPLFAQALDKSDEEDQAACLSNLRQLGMAITQYAQDWDDTLPNAYDFLWPRCWSNEDGSNKNPVGIALETYCQPQIHGCGTRADVENPPEMTSNVWLCPTARSLGRPFNDTSYDCPQYLDWPNPNDPTKDCYQHERLTGISHPELLVYAVDDNKPGTKWTDYWAENLGCERSGPADVSASCIHNNGRNALYFDGHATWLPALEACSNMFYGAWELGQGWEGNPAPF